MQKTKQACNLEKDSEDKLWERFYAGREKGNGGIYRNKLSEKYSYLAKEIAWRLNLTLPEHIELDDLVSDGAIGLLKSFKNFDPSKAKFETHASKRIKGEIVDSIRKRDLVPRFVRERNSQVEKAINNLENKLGRKPYPDELIEELSDDKLYPSNPENLKKPLKLKGQKKAELIIAESVPKKIFSLYTSPLQYSEKIPLIDDIENTKSPDPVSESQKREIKEIVLNYLTPIEGQFIELHYYKELDQKKIASIFKLSEAKISKMHTLIKTKLKKQMNQESN